MCQNRPQVVTVEGQTRQAAQAVNQTIVFAIPQNVKLAIYAIGAILLLKAIK